MAFWLANTLANTGESFGEIGAEEGDCLLASRSHLSRQQALHQQSSRHRSWSEEHRRLCKVANETSDSLQQFIESQMASNDHCSARLMESKRTLDGLLKDLSAITSQTESHEEVRKTESEILHITHNAIDAVESSFDEDTAACEKLKQDAQEDLKTFTGELEELKQIANPEVRYKHVVNVTIPPVSAPSNRSPAALLGEGMNTWSSQQCHTFVNFAQHSAVGMAAAAKNLTCDEQRAELQKVYTETYIAVLDLIKDAMEREKDSSCMRTAKAKRTAELVPLTSQRESAAGRIEYSTQALAMLKPVLDMLDRRVESLEKHINLTLTPECQEAAKVTSSIKVVRDLIVSLEKCPGRNDFRLQIPAENTTSTAAPDLLQMKASGVVEDSSIVKDVAAQGVTNSHDAHLKPKLLDNSEAPQALQARSHRHKSESLSEDTQIPLIPQKKEDTQIHSIPQKKEDTQIHSIPQRKEESSEEKNDGSNVDDEYDAEDDENDSISDEDDEYDEIQTRVETKSTPNGTVTSYIDEKVETDDDNNKDEEQNSDEIEDESQ